MTARPGAVFIVVLSLSAPAAAQRPTIPTKVTPGAAAASAAPRLPLVRASPGGGETLGLPGSTQPARSVIRTDYLGAAAKRDLLGASGVAGTPADATLRVEPAPRGTRAYVRLEGPGLVGNRSTWSSGEVAHVPFATFVHDRPQALDAVVVVVEPGGADRYLVDCEMGVLDQFDVVTGLGRTRVSIGADVGHTGHARFLLEGTDPGRGASFRITPAEIGPWTFFGCELTPIT